MNYDEHDDVWELLGRAKPAIISPFFSRNVLRAVREEKPASPGVVAWMLRRWPFLAAAACALVVAGIALMPQPEPVDSVDALVEYVSTSPDYAVIGNLDELLAAEQSSVWLNLSIE